MPGRLVPVNLGSTGFDVHARVLPLPPDPGTVKLIREVSVDTSISGAHFINHTKSPHPIRDCRPGCSMALPAEGSGKRCSSCSNTGPGSIRKNSIDKIGTSSAPVICKRNNPCCKTLGIWLVIWHITVTVTYISPGCYQIQFNFLVTLMVNIYSYSYGNPCHTVDPVRGKINAYCFIQNSKWLTLQEGQPSLCFHYLAMKLLWVVILKLYRLYW